METPSPSRLGLPNLWIRSLGIGLPLTIALLIGSQPSVYTQLQATTQAWFNPLAEPYRYPFNASLPRNRSAIPQLRQEIAFYQERIQKDAQRGLDYAALALTYLRMARTTGQGHWYLLAEQTAQQSLTHLPFDNADAQLVLARVAEAKHDFPGALRLAEQLPEREAIALAVTSHLAMGQLDEADQAATQLVDATLSANAFTLQALVQVAQGKPQEALQSFHYALEVEEPGELSNSARLRTTLGRFYYEQGRLELATDLYQEALRLLPGYQPALVNLAQVKLRQGQYNAADRLYQQAIAMSDTMPTLYQPTVLRGQAQIQKQRGNPAIANRLWQEAELLLRETVPTTPSTAQPSFGHQRELARLLLERGNPGDRTEAVALMQQEITLRRDAPTLATYAGALAATERWQEAQG
ncbi:MAG: tetratricopeptide repeat protein [Leptolyngbyaceae cyanobacterium SL_7_1]|nr:tetratricopeptide repeat protein [Leptolyngbyaceae cyanobacterium SL_7_1]